MILVPNKSPSNDGQLQHSGKGSQFGDPSQQRYAERSTPFRNESDQIQRHLKMLGKSGHSESTFSFSLGIQSTIELALSNSELTKLKMDSVEFSKRIGYLKRILPG